MNSGFLVSLLCVFLFLTVIPSQNDSEHVYFDPPHNITPSFNWKCFACSAGASVLKAAYFASQSQKCLAAIVAKICVGFSIENSRVCDAISSQYKDEVLYVLGQLLLTPRQFCGFILENCSDAYNPLTNNWTVPLPDRNHVQSSGRQGERRTDYRKGESQPTLRVLQLSDIHLDPFYAAGSEADCSYPLCCRNRTSQNDPVKRPAGKWGSEGRCDIPFVLLENLFQHLRDNEKFDYIIWTGDIPPHNVWNQTRRDQLNAYNYLVKMLMQYFPNKMVFSTVGNHESAPADSFPPHFFYLPRKFSIAWLYDALAVHWTHWVPKANRVVIRNKASYMAVLFPGLRLISINTNYCLTTNFWLYLNDTDPDQALSWLVEQLHDAEKAGDKVHIIGHTPTGDNNCLPRWSYNYYRIINRFADTVVAQFFGHRHTDQFAVFYEDADYKKPATNMMYIAPSVTTYDRYLPAYRIYTIDGNHSESSWSVLDFETYYLNLTEANLLDRPQWKLEYRAKEAYGLQDLSPNSWSKLIDTMLHNDSLAEAFIRHVYRTGDPSCDRNCFLDILCQLRSGRSQDGTLCSDLPKPVRNDKFRKNVLADQPRKPAFPIPFIPSECQPKKRISTKMRLNGNCQIIQNECHSSECGQICEGIVDEHSIFGQPSRLNACREAVCHVSAACCCTH